MSQATLPIFRNGGLWYPIGVSVMTLVIGLVFLRDTKGVDISTGSGVSIQKG